MRVVHLATRADTGHVVPRCGVWGSMDADWTELAYGVTCAGCRTAMGRDSERAVEEVSAGASVVVPTRSLGRSTLGLQRLVSAVAGSWTRHRPRLRPS